VLPDAEIVDASELIWREKAVLMPHEIARVKQAARIAMDAYRDVASIIRAGVTEIETSQLIEAKLTIAKVSDATRAFGHVACMSGPNSVVAYGSYALSTGRRMQPGDLVLTHCNSTVDGYWTDITRTYSIGEPTADVRAMYDALLRASLAGIACVKPGARGAEIDSAVRNSLERDGFAAAFKHGTGHGVGFAAIDHRAKPRVRPHSPDVLEPGMIFNIEPGIYIDGVGGMRQCDMVLCTPDGAEVLTPFHNTIEQLML
jgi:Xaa-Pro aminopeptidase